MSSGGQFSMSSDSVCYQGSAAQEAKDLIALYGQKCHKFHKPEHVSEHCPYEHLNAQEAPHAYALIYNSE